MVDNILDYFRIVLYAALIVLGFLFFQAWQNAHPSVAASTTTPTNAVSSNQYIPSAPSYAGSSQVSASNEANAAAIANNAVPTAPASAATPSKPIATGQIITVNTDVLQMNIDTKGGDIIGTQLLKYPVSLGSSTPFLLFNDQSKTRYLAESGLLSAQGPDTSAGQAIYTAAQKQYSLSPQQKELIVTLTWQNNNLIVNKIFTFTRGSYEIKVNYEIINKSANAWQGNIYNQLLRTNDPPEKNKGLGNLTTYFGAAISSPAKPFEKISFKEMQEQNLSRTVTAGWAAMIQHYFISAWIPPKDAAYNYYSHVLPNGLFSIGMMSGPITVPAQAQVSTQEKLYAGPAIAEKLEQAAPRLKFTIDYGWFWFISVIIFWMMKKIYDVVGNWGWSIVLVTIVIKLLFYQLSAKSYRSMSAMKKLQPRIEHLKELYGNDKQKLTQATLELYKQEKVNPMSGCLPVLIQIPVFIALYWVLVESVELRQAPFIFWIHDLSQQDPYLILPLLMGLSMFLQQRMNPPSPDPLQQKIMMFMPVIFVAIFWHMPAGLMLYWFVNNTLSFLQQWYVMHRLDKESHAKH